MIESLILSVLTLCPFGTQSHPAFMESDAPSEFSAGFCVEKSENSLRDEVSIPIAGNTGLLSDVSDVAVASSFKENSIEEDTLHITPADLKRLRENQPIHEFKRELESVVFVPKGQWVTGISISFSQSNQNNYQFLVIQGLSGDTYSFKVSPMVCYMFGNDIGAGAKFGYNRSLTKLEKADIVFDEDTEFTADHLYSLSHNYYFTGILRNYFSIGKSKRFGFFNEVQLTLGGGQSKLTRGVGDSLTGTYERNFQFNIGLAPGLAVFLNNYSALEVNIGVLGFSYRDTKSISDQIYVAHHKSQSANFRINLFSITFGMAFYL